MNNTSTYAHIIEAAADYADVKTEDMHSMQIGLAGTEYEISFHTDFMEYTMYVDFGGAVLGFLSQPYEAYFTEAVSLIEKSHCA